MRRKSAQPPKLAAATSLEAPQDLLTELRDWIQQARISTARAIDEELCALYWRIGTRIRQEILELQRAAYGSRIVSAVGTQLEAEFGRGFSEKSIRHMIRFAEAFPDEQIVSALRRHLSWTHFKRLSYLEDPLKRDFYAQMCRVESWATRTLEKKIDSMLFERTALSRKPAALIEEELTVLRDEDKLTPDLVFRDPYLLDFLGLKDTYSEKDLEAAILRDMESFILELGVGFAFLERQKRITIDGDDYYLDLLFFHRRLRRLVVIELKLRDFKPADKGQMELYLRWLDQNERREEEDAPIGLILCAGKKEETVRLLDMEGSGIRVAAYLLEAVPREQLARKLHEAVALARRRLVEQASDQGPLLEDDR
jgi:predicted nuclease of restriction endonuclease-like (RecB) superfamily